MTIVPALKGSPDVCPPPLEDLGVGRRGAWLVREELVPVDMHIHYIIPLQSSGISHVLKG